MKGFFKFLITVILFAVIFLAVQRLVMPKYVSDVKEGGFTAEYYRETTDHQVLMVGDCEVYENFDPVTIYQNYGITSYIRGSAQQLTWQSYYLLEDALKYETPDVVVFNVLELKYNTPQHEEYNRMTLDGMRWSMSKVNAIKASMLDEENFIEYAFPFLRYHSRITDLSSDDFKYYANDIQRSVAGYYMRVDTAAYQEGEWDEEKPDNLIFGTNAMKYLDKIRILCDENNIKLLLVKAPSISPVWYDEQEQQIEHYADCYDLDYINFLELVDELGIDFSTDTYDEGLHMNLSGATKISDYLGKYLAENYNLKDQSGDPVISAAWSEKISFHDSLKAAQEEEIEKYGKVKSY